MPAVAHHLLHHRLAGLRLRLLRPPRLLLLLLRRGLRLGRRLLRLFWRRRLRQHLRRRVRCCRMLCLGRNGLLRLRPRLPSLLGLLLLLPLLLLLLLVGRLRCLARLCLWRRLRLTCRRGSLLHWSIAAATRNMLWRAGLLACLQHCRGALRWSIRLRRCLRRHCWSRLLGSDSGSRRLCCLLRGRCCSCHRWRHRTVASRRRCSRLASSR